MNSTAEITDRRIRKRNLADLLVHKFLHEYGYEHGPVIAQAIVEDLLTTIQACCPERLPPKTVVWLAVRKERPGRHKGLAAEDLIPVRLAMLTEAEIKLLTDPQLRQERQAVQSFNQARLVRWCHDTYEQGGVLSQLDLCLLSGLSVDYVRRAIQRYETQTGKVVPTRGTVHDMGRSVSHKAEVIRRWLRHEGPAQIARTLNHSQQAVDRYLADYQKVRTLAQKFPETELPILTGLTATLVEQYLALLREYEPELTLAKSDRVDPPPAA
jgi:hypothetical protein